MLKRIYYSITKRFLKFTFHTFAMFVFLFFLTSSLLISNLSSVFRTVFSENMDKRITISSIHSSFFDPDQDLQSYMDFEKQYLQLTEELKKQEGVTYTDTSISLNRFNRITTSSFENGSFSFLATGVSDESLTPDIFQQYLKGEYYLMTPDIRGVMRTDSTPFEKEQVKVFSGTNFTNAQLEQADLVCMVPFKSEVTFVSDSGKSYIEEGGILPISVYIADENGNLIAQKQWNLQVIGVYYPVNPSRHKWIQSKDQEFEKPVLIPLNTLLNIQKETAELMSQYGVIEQTTTRIDPIELKFDDVENLQKCKKFIENSQLYQEGCIDYVSGIDVFGLLLASIDTTTDSFQKIAGLILCISLIYAGLLSWLNANERRKEIAVLQSMGEKKVVLVAQFVLEQMISYVIAFLLAFFLSSIAIRYFSVYLIHANIADTTSTFAKAVSVSFVGFTEKLTDAQLMAMIHYQALQYAILTVSTVLMILVHTAVTTKMVRKFHARSILNGGQ